ncbi:hypothetical protein E2C01_001366 [Portunus trituberculatus]|uniref:Uncharacterized protein n=1 Tax=Portunus trituberculatus TaxID=210409 RepID=A0A5B7CHN5_PORTR|nr:hypothetical protein [Portunus trituberculatus]
MRLDGVLGRKRRQNPHCLRPGRIRTWILWGQLPGVAEGKGAEEWREGTDIYRSSLPSLLLVAAADNEAFPNSLMEVAAAGMYYRLNCEMLDHIFHETLDV